MGISGVRVALFVGDVFVALTAIGGGIAGEAGCWAVTTTAPRIIKEDDEMDNQVLVAYASKYGATAEIADKIGQVLRQAGLQADVLPTRRVSDLTPYQAVVLGSAVYIGKWRKEAVKFLQANEVVLAEKPVWLFSSGPTGEGDPLELTEGWRLPEKLQPTKAWPWTIVVFFVFLFGQFVIGYFFSEFLMENVVLWAVLFLGLLVLSILAGYGHDVVKNALAEV